MIAPVPQAAARAQLPKAVVGIKKSRTKKGDLQYLVVYDGEKNDRGHWVSINELRCTPLIEKYEADNPRVKAEQASAPPQKVSEVLGLSHHNDELYYVVRFGESAEPRFVSRSYASRHCTRQVLDFYQKHLTFESEVGAEEFGKLMAVRGMKPIAAPSPVAPEPSPMDSDTPSDSASDV